MFPQGTVCDAAGIRPTSLSFRAGALISIMLDTQRKDLLFSLSDTVTGKDDRGEEWERYLLDPSLLLEETAVQPLILFTSGEDLIEAETEADASCIIAFGDSITALSVWTKPLAERLEKAYHGKYVLLNSGISGSCLLYERDDAMAKLFGEAGVKRFERDVLSLPYVSTVIIALGVNDVSYLSKETADIISREAFIQAVGDIAAKLHERNIRVCMSTITPRLKCALTMRISPGKWKISALR